ncbi:L-threonylcarbamoyladenylate synthase [Flavihumibacter petaseus]|uniref:Threonylcarbamoyl-AMP synthase n=1 Tax=Flavihumibacter petaseus NBRC 106054 TaxID=1220578 RepID=A0A0E9N0E8_9BACT|nr:L-threonylcarbamoyladenylate synthase [Flavihumibacter petaseus]GAO43467.1 L-threonylcarbamoyladenylate synthase [Flavihumibacter petaseus NBRC 106054]
MGTDIEKAAALLREGALVAIPTETVYGLAANALNEAAVVKIYQAKQRPQFNPLILHVADAAQLDALNLSLPAAATRLYEQFSPGPLTYVIPSSSKIPGIITAGTPAVAVRIPQHPLTLRLLKTLDFPLAAPSANPSGRVSPTTAAHVAEQLGDKVAYILDGGPCRIGVESTIISFLEDQPRLLRYGGVAVEAIEKLIGPVARPEKGYVDNPVAPGQLARHYATRHPLQLGNAATLIREALRSDPIPRIASISLNSIFPELPDAYQFRLSASGSLEEAASRLFAAMRLADDMDIDLIIADRFPEEGLGLAINDRLQRAANS